MSNNEILSPIETERTPIRQTISPDKLKIDSPQASRISFKDPSSPAKSRNNADDKNNGTLSEIEKTLEPTESRPRTKTRIIEGAEGEAPKRRSRNLGTKLGSKVLDDRRKTKKMTTRSQNRERRRKHEEEEEELDLHAQSNSELYNLQTYYHKATKAIQEGDAGYQRKEEVKKSLKRYQKILRFKLNLPLPIIEIPPFFEETRHKINEERDIPKTEMLRDIEIGEKGDLEILRDKKDHYPFAAIRRKISKTLM